MARNATTTAARKPAAEETTIFQEVLDRVGEHVADFSFAREADDQKFLARLVRAAVDMPEEEWNSMSVAAQEWGNDAITAMNKHLDIELPEGMEPKEIKQPRKKSGVEAVAERLDSRRKVKAVAPEPDPEPEEPEDEEPEGPEDEELGEEVAEVTPLPVRRRAVPTPTPAPRRKAVPEPEPEDAEEPEDESEPVAPRPARRAVVTPPPAAPVARRRATVAPDPEPEDESEHDQPDRSATRLANNGVSAVREIRRFVILNPDADVAAISSHLKKNGLKSADTTIKMTRMFTQYCVKEVKELGCWKEPRRAA